jgi:hypothetical protein
LWCSGAATSASSSSGHSVLFEVSGGISLVWMKAPEEVSDSGWHREENVSQ